MTRSKTGYAAAVALALLAMTGTAEANQASAKTLCSILDQSDALPAKCRVSAAQKAVDIRLDSTPEKAAVACPKLVEAWAGIKLPWDAGWNLRILSLGTPRTVLAQCAF